MEQLHNGYTLELSEGAFPLSTDSIALADFVKLKPRASVLDLGAGCGTLGLLLCAKDSTCRITGIEIDPFAHDMVLKNAAANGLGNRLNSICADLTSIHSLIKAGSFSCCISNPPYFSGGPESKTLSFARRDDLCSMEALISGAAWGLKYGGDFFLVHRPERLAEIFSISCKHKLEPKRLRLLRHNLSGPVSLVLIQCRKGASPGLIWEEKALYNSDNQPTEYYRRLYHL
ncbi:MAG: methyltransferase [Oscillospiraceae bacterium]|nr:methyltransferase [Oscillospiraceae bacterium]